MLIDDGILLRALVFSPDVEQLRRFKARDGMTRSAMEAQPQWTWNHVSVEDYCAQRRDVWCIPDTCQPLVRGGVWISKHARLNMMAHLLSTIDYADVESQRSVAATAACNYRRPLRVVDIRRLCGHVDRPVTQVHPGHPGHVAATRCRWRKQSSTALLLQRLPIASESYEGDDEELAEAARSGVGVVASASGGTSAPPQTPAAQTRCWPPRSTMPRTVPILMTRSIRLAGPPRSIRLSPHTTTPALSRP